MTSESRKIPFEVEIGRVIELLANQIYQSPLALLRENAQNAFDAVLMRRALGDQFDPTIVITISEHEIVVTDNGVGMTADQLESNYWRAGSSGKNTPEARAAGVVGTFGIGAMANFGIATSLTVETESVLDRVRIRSQVEAEDLSTSEPCISLEPMESRGEPGTIVAARLVGDRAIDVQEAVRYISQFVEFVDIRVVVNGDLVSQRDPRTVLPSEAGRWREEATGVPLGDFATADVEVLGLASGEVRAVLTNVRTSPEAAPGRAVLVQGESAIRTLRSGFGLATVSVSSLYRFGGIVDLPALQPTAGREALEDSSNALLSRLVSAVDSAVSELGIEHSEFFENTAFLDWLNRHGRYDVCGLLAVRVEPENGERTLGEFADSTVPVRYYTGSDQELITATSSFDSPLIIVSRRGPRRECELGFLRSIGAVEVEDHPQLIEESDPARLRIAHGAIAYRVAQVLAEDYFVELDVVYGTMTHGIPILLERGERPRLVIDPGWPVLTPLLELYTADFATFGPFVKDFVRSHVFQKVADLVPTSTRDGAEAFMRRLRGRRELFEIDYKDREDLDAIWGRWQDGEISLTEAAKRSMNVARRSVVVVQQNQQAEISSVVEVLEDAVDPDVDLYAALPPIDRREEVSDALLLTGAGGPNGYSCFLALAEQAHRQNGEFFFEAHSTSVVWGGGKVLFVFQHHTERFGLYYDVQCASLVAPSSGGGPYRTSTIVLGNRIFIPVPDEIAHNFIPGEGERIRFEVRSDILYLRSEGEDS